MDMIPVGVEGAGVASTTPSFLFDDAVSKLECSRCPEVCMYEQILFALRTESCQRIRAERNAADLADSFDRMQTQINDLLDAGRTPPEIQAALGLSKHEYCEIYLH